jgi:hypothetical protein
MKSGVGAAWISLVILLIVVQRSFDSFTYLCTTICIDELLALLMCVLFLGFLRENGKKKLLYGFFFMLALLYNTFCIELNVVVPFAIGVGLMMTKKEKALALSCFMVGVLYLVLYFVLIWRHTVAFYDSSHGSSETMMSNAINILLLQKLLIVMFCIFVYRTIMVFVKKESYCAFSDTMLGVAVIYTIGAFVLRLSWGLYYTVPIIFAIPSMINVLSFENRNKQIISVSIVLLFGVYHFVKFPAYLNSLYENKVWVYSVMRRFNDNLKDKKDIVWYAEEQKESVKEVSWMKGHAFQSLQHLYKDEDFELKSVKDLGIGYTLLTPKETDIKELEKAFPDFRFIKQDDYFEMSSYLVE